MSKKLKDSSIFWIYFIIINFYLAGIDLSNRRIKKRKVLERLERPTTQSFCKGFLVGFYTNALIILFALLIIKGII